MHVDIRMIGNVPDADGWRINGRAAGKRKSSATRGANRPHKVHGRLDPGYCCVHTAVSAYSRLAYSGALGDETAATALAFPTRSALD